MAENSIDNNKPQLETFALFEQVKQDIYKGWTELNEIYTQNLTDYGEGYAVRFKDRFKAKLLSFYAMISTKVSYPKAKKFLVLNNLKKYANDIDSLTYDNALKYFFLMGELMEAIGITRIGKMKFDHLKSPFERV